MASLYDEKVLGAKEKLALARKLQEGSNEAAGQMVSGWYVPNYGGAAKDAIKSIMGGYQEGKAQEELDNANREKNTALSRALLATGQPISPEMRSQLATPAQEPSLWDKGKAFVTGNDQPQGTPRQEFTEQPQQNLTPEQRTAAIANLMQYSPEIAAPMMQGEQFNMQRGDRKAESEASRAARAEEKAAQREWEQKRMESEHEFRKQMQDDSQASRAELAAAVRAAGKGSGGQARNDWQLIKGDDGMPRGRYNTATGQFEAAQGVPQGQAPRPKLDVTAEKAILESDELAKSSQNVIGMLNQAKNINAQTGDKKPYSGFGAGTRAAIMSNLGGTPSADATVNLDNIMQGQALESLKSTFGGNPTEGERKILLDLQASSSKTPKQRDEIISRAISAAENRAQYHGEKANALRGGTYFTQGVPQQPAKPQVTIENW